MMNILSIHTDSLLSHDRKRALRALSALAEIISPQSVAFEREAVTYVPHLLALALNRKTVAQAELISYLSNVHDSALWAWRRNQESCAPDESFEYNEMVAWENSVAASYENSAPAAMALLEGTVDARVRGATIQLASRLKSCRASLTSMLPQMFSETDEAGLKVDIIEALAQAGITLAPDEETSTSTYEWVNGRRRSETPGVRLGATLSLLPRVDPVLQESLKESAMRSSDEERAAALEAMWLHERTIEWATRRSVRPTRYLA
ncbi:hypothetical protein ABT097_05510 [Streptomyces sp. NPDC002225]|uniref:hypothetical protein n=1 Tax=Streptomyces sp. NPDC002225 TaxID=3154413 RepID=UPI00332DCBD9